jgi:hypothetical protein
MDAYIYCADIYCEDCGEKIREDIDREGLAPTDPDDEHTYDSEEYPKGPYAEGGGESDCPQHCGSGADCVNAIELYNGTKIGAFLENPLTSDGLTYARESYETEKTEVTELWRDFYCDGFDWD